MRNEKKTVTQADPFESLTSDFPLCNSIPEAHVIANMYFNLKKKKMIQDLQQMQVFARYDLYKVFLTTLPITFYVGLFQLTD